MGINVGGYEINSSVAKTFASNEIIQNGLVLNLDASTIESYQGSSTSLYDLSANSNTSTLTNGASYVSTSGGGIYMDGVSNYVLVPNSTSIQMTAAMSINVWFSIPQNGLPYRQALLSKPYYNYELGIYPGGTIHTYTRAGTGTSAPSYDEGCTAQHPAGDWQANRMYNVTWTLNGTAETSYFEGTLAVSGGTYTKGHSGTDDAGQDLLLGTRNASDLWFKGTIYAVHIYNRALSSTEVLHNYNVQKGRFGL
jgi:hypothetical protein